jgi:hypothetical protein
MKFFGSSLFDGGSSRHGGGGRSSAGDGYLTKSLSRSRGMTALGNRRELACIHTCHPRNIEFSILLIVQHHYILWSSPFQIVNSKVTFSYINLKFQNLQRKSTLHFPVLHNAGGCAMLGLCTNTARTRRPIQPRGNDLQIGVRAS